MRLIFVPLLFLVLWVPMSNAKENQQVAIVIHGGAGTILRERMSTEVEQAYRGKLLEAVRAGHDVLTNGGSSLAAVIAAITIMEDSDLFNAGRGAVFTHEERVELDASIMEGRNLNAGAITGVTRVRNPILLASEVLHNSPHVMLMGEGAEEFAAERGIKLVENSYFHTERRREQLKRAKAKEKDDVSLSEDAGDDFGKALGDKTLGTVGAVAIDITGDIAAGTSTGGMTNKRFGRIGDSPIIGAGTYADNRTCGISATGHGEYFIRAAVAHDICARVAYMGLGLKEAADQVVHERLVAMGADGGIIGLDADANIVFSFNSEGMYRAAIDKHGKEVVAIFR